MKELIEIPDSNVIANTEGCFGISFDGMDYQKIIMGGTPIPNNATNGDMVKAMFPDYHVQISTALESVNLYYEDTEEYAGSWIRFDLNWWNASYKRGNENGKN